MVNGLKARSTSHDRPNLGGPLHAGLGWLKEELPNGQLRWQYLMKLPRHEVLGVLRETYPNLEIFRVADTVSLDWMLHALERLVEQLRELRATEILVEYRVPALWRPPTPTWRQRWRRTFWFLRPGLPHRMRWKGFDWKNLEIDLQIHSATCGGWVVMEIKTGRDPIPMKTAKMRYYMAGAALHSHKHFPDQWRIVKGIWMSFATHDGFGNPSPMEPVVTMDTLEFRAGEMNEWARKRFGVGFGHLFDLERAAA